MMQPFKTIHVINENYKFKLMKRPVQFFFIIVINILFIVLLISQSCTIVKNSGETKEQWKPSFRFQAGINHGGIIENTDLSEVDGYSGATNNNSVDAFSGATNAGFNTGIHLLLPVFNNNIETGLDYMHNNQKFTFNDTWNNYSGERKIGVSQFTIPVTFSFGLIKKNNPDGIFQFKIGYLGEINFLNFTDSNSGLPAYSYNKFSQGVTLGFSSTPFKLPNGAKMGFYLDFYRGSQIYDDFYNKSSFEMPGSGFAKVGIIYNFNNK